MNLPNFFVTLISVIITLISVIITAAFISVASDYRWQKALKSLDVEIKWHRHVVDGIATDWVEMINLRDGDVRKVEVKE